MSLNQKQFLASDPRTSCWVMASAGTGKTKVLIDRILRLLLEGNDPKHILCLTYTKAAALEMRERLIKKAEQWQIITEDSLQNELEIFTQNQVSKDHIEIAKNLFDSLNHSPIAIQTIHSFCQSLLSSFSLELDISPTFKLIDEREKRLLQQQVCSEILAKNELQEHFDFLSPHISENYLREILCEAMNERLRLSCLSDPLGKLKALLCDSKSPDLSEQEWHTIKKMAAFSAEFGPKNLQEVAPIILGNDEKSYQNLFSFFLTKEGEVRKKFTLASAKNFDFTEDDFQKIGERIQAIYEGISAKEILSINQHLHVCIEATFNLYQLSKKEQGLLDFDDLLLYVQTLLTTNQGWIFEKIDFRLDHILIDEAQDTSRVQWNIIKNLLHHFFDRAGHNNMPRTMFVVGDAKQSIYSFQGADPKYYLEVRDYFTHLAEENSHTFNIIDLDLCYRQSPAVLNLVDQVFATAEKSQNLLSHTINHYAFRSSSQGLAYHLPLTKKCDAEDQEPWTIQVNTKIQKSSHALVIKDLVLSILSEKEILPSTSDVVNPDDIMILFQRRSSLMQETYDALKEVGISCTSCHHGDVLSHLAVLDLLSILKFVALKEDNFNLACLLRSPLFNIDESLLQQLCTNGKSSLFQKLLMTEECHEIIGRFTEYLELFQSADSLYDFCSKLVHEIAPVMVGHFGEQVLDLYEEFLSYVLEASQKGITEIDAFISYITTLSPNSKNQKGNGVNLMTVHGSKGLEAPIVIVADATASLVNAQNSLIFEDDFYFLRTSHTPLKKLKAIEKDNDIAESHRLLYVALTRAKDHIFIAGEENHKSENWYEFCQPLTQEYQLKTSFDKPAIAQVDKLDRLELPDITFKRKLRKEPTLVSPKTEKSRRGEAIHKLMEMQLWKFDEKLREAALSKPLFKELPPQDIEKICTLPHNSELGFYLSQPYQSEAEIYCKGNGLQRLDYLLVEEDKVTIIDFKTTENPASTAEEISSTIFKQMQTYRNTLQELYVDKLIECFVFYTENQKLIKLNMESLIQDHNSERNILYKRHKN